MGLVFFVGTTAAQSPGEAFCNTDMAQTIQKLFTLFRFAVPVGLFLLAIYFVDCVTRHQKGHHLVAESSRASARRP